MTGSQCCSELSLSQKLGRIFRWEVKTLERGIAFVLRFKIPTPYFSIQESSYLAPRPVNRKFAPRHLASTWTMTAGSAATFAFIPRLCLSLSLLLLLSPPPYLLMPSSSSIYRGPQRAQGVRRSRIRPGVCRSKGPWGSGSFKKPGEWLPPQLRNF